MIQYGNTIANLACSILKYFGAEGTGNPTLPVADRLLQKDYKNIVVLLLDGMGTEIMKRNLEPDGFLNTHLTDTYSSVYPPTTVAATASMDSGLYPNQHSWLGWTCYYKELNKNVVVYLNADEEGNPAAEFNAAWTYCPYKSVIKRVKEAGYEAYSVSPFGSVKADDFEEICQQIKRLCHSGNKKYIYAYWTEPDSIMHRRGCFSAEAKAALREIERSLKNLSSDLEDTLVLVTADHGHMDSRNTAITEYPEIMECLVRMPSIEPRTLNCFIKEGKKEQFVQAFNEAFGDSFKLFSREEIEENHLFGLGENHPRFKEMVGDFVAVAISDVSIFNTERERDICIGVHAGMTEAELNIPLVAVSCIK